MSALTKRFLTVFLLFFFAGVISGQTLQMSFDRISTSNGLSQNRVTCLLQDHSGYIWVGTQDGLNRFDGHDFVVYQHNRSDLKSISANHIRCLQEGGDGSIWVGTEAGLNRCQGLDGVFERFLDDPSVGWGHDWINCIYEDGRNRLWVGTSTGLYHRTHDKMFSQEFEENAIYAITDKLIDHNICIGTDMGFFVRIDEDAYDGGLVLLQSHLINAFLLTGKGSGKNLWAGTDDGIFRIDPTNVRSPIQLMRKERALFSHPSSRSVLCVTALKDRIWVGTKAGLFAFDLGTEEWVRVRPRRPDDKEFFHGAIRCLWADRDGALWVGTDFGLFRQSPPKRFKTHTQIQELSAELGDVSVSAIVEDKNGWFWIGTSAGLVHYNPTTEIIKKVYRHNPDDPNSLSDDDVRAVCRDGKGNLWIGTQKSGLNRLDLQTGRCDNYRFDADASKGSISSDHIRRIFEDRRGVLWVGTNGGGLNRLDPQTGRFSRFVFPTITPSWNKKNDITYLFEDDAARFWVGTRMGAHWFDRAHGTFLPIDEAPKKLTQNAVFSISQNQDGDIWFTTDSGLVRLEHETHKFVSFGSPSMDGLANLAPYEAFDLEREWFSGIDDDQGRLWLSSTNALMRFNPRTLEMNRFYNGDGLQSGAFNPGAVCRSNEGTVFFGGENGLNSFSPASIELWGNRHDTKITYFRFFSGADSSESPWARSGFADGFPSEKGGYYQIPHDSRSLHVRFSSMNLALPDGNRYKTQLLADSITPLLLLHISDVIGTRKHAPGWQRAKANHLTLFDLPAGKYTLHVYGSNHDGNFSQQPAELKFAITPHPWSSIWAFGFYFLGLALFVWGIRKTVGWKQFQELKRQKQLNEQLQKIGKMKDHFLARTSHELKTPLHGIVGIAESLADEGLDKMSREEIVYNLKLICSSGQRLTHLVNDIQDLEKIKDKDLTLHVKPVDLGLLVEGVLHLFQPIFKTKGLSHEFQIEPGRFIVQADENRLEQILNNLIGNAVKFSQQGPVTVSAEEKEGMVHVSVKDRGIGIPFAETDTIFQSFEQLDAPETREYGGTGLGLSITKQLVELHGGDIHVFSVPGKGSTFTFSLPKSDELPVTPILSRYDGLVGKPLGRPSEPTDISTRLIKQANRILIVDDEPVNLQVLINHLTLNDFKVEVVSSGKEALNALDSDKNNPFDLMLLDIMMPRMSGYEVCREVRKRYTANELPIIMLTVKNQVADLVKGLEAGANDFISKPFSKNELLARIKSHLLLLELNRKIQAERQYLLEEIKLQHNFEHMVGQSLAFRKVLQKIEQVAPTSTTVLILGETGTGKELLARAIHNLSPRRQRALVTVNCAALPENLIESELFGHEKGAFTGATRQKTGRFRYTHGGTIFLDEIGDLPLGLQAKLLRVLQEGEFEPVGSNATQKVDVRMLAATNRNLEQAVKDGEFREDLYFRLKVFSIVSPPLRERKEDIPLLVAHFLPKFCTKIGKKIDSVPQKVLQAFQAYSWPGNIRELENAIEQAVILTQGHDLQLGEWIPKDEKTPETGGIATLAEREKRHIETVLQHTGWRIRGEGGAAQLLGIKPTTLEARMKKLGITRE